MDSFPPCPRCEGSLTLRTNSRTKEKFWGCSEYPECRFTRPIPPPPTGEEPECVNCHVPMVLRIKGESSFYGCPFWRECGAKTVSIKRSIF